MSYFGGKGGMGVHQTIINQIPPHYTFISGFAGKCAVYRNLKKARKNFIIDKDESLEDWWYKEHGYLDFIIDDFFNINNTDQSPKELSLNNQLWRLWVEDKETFIYLDPPYLKSTRKSDRNIYKHELTEDEHIKLLAIIKKLPCMVGISHYPCDLYDTELADWRKITFSSQTRKGMATEAFYMNYEVPGELHDYRYLGGDYKQRERIKKKFDRWKKNFENLPLLEQEQRKRFIETL